MTKCNGIDCPIKKNCRRYLERKQGQAYYFNYAPFSLITGKCKYLKEVVHIFGKNIAIKKYGDKEERKYAKMFERSEE